MVGGCYMDLPTVFEHVRRTAAAVERSRAHIMTLRAGIRRTSMTLQKAMALVENAAPAVALVRSEPCRPDEVDAAKTAPL